MSPLDNKTTETTYVPGYDTEVNALAYIKPVQTGAGAAFAVCSADGLQLAVFASRDIAMSAARQHDLEPVQIH